MKKIILTFIIIAIGVGGMLGLKSYLGKGKMSESEPKNLSKTKGAADAPIQITEFIDFQCPACAKGAIYLNQYNKDNPGKIRLEMKFFPLRSHQHAMLSAQYAECAARQNKFWPVHDKIVEKQDQWRQLTDATPAFDLFVKQSGADIDVLKACLNDPSVDQAILADKDEGVALGVKSTPSYVVNGSFIVGMKSLKAKIAEILNENN